MLSVWRTGLSTAAGLGRAEVADTAREQRRRVRTKPHLEFMSFKRTEKSQINNKFLGYFNNITSLFALTSTVLFSCIILSYFGNITFKS